MAIYLHSEFEEYTPDNPELIPAWLKSVINEEEKKPGDINIIITGDKQLKEMNIKFLNSDSLTDVIAFDYGEKNIIAGDIFVSYERVVENAESLSVNVKLELHRVIVHGLLHLIGYKDKLEQEKKEIQEKENYYLGKMPD